MEKRDKFTNEHLRKKFKSQFEMVNCAIHQAEDIIRRGDLPHLSHESQNVALHVIELINLDKPLAMRSSDSNGNKSLELEEVTTDSGKKNKKK